MTTSQTRAMEEVLENPCAIRPLIRSFFQSLTQDQWKLLTSGAPDESTKILLAELLLDITRDLSKVFLSARGAFLTGSEGSIPTVTQEVVQASVGDEVSHGFRDVMEVDGRLHCDSTRHLEDLIASDVTLSVKSILSSNHRPPVNKHITPPRTLNRMLDHAIAMVKAFARRMKCKFRLQPRKRTSQRSSDRDLLLPNMDRDSEISSSVEMTSSDATRSFQWSHQRERVNSVQEKVESEMRDFIHPLMDELPDSEYVLMQSEISQQISVVSREIAADLESLKCQSVEKSKAFWKGIHNKIKTFAAKLFAKVRLTCIMTQLRKDFHAKPESQRSWASDVPEIIDSFVERDEEKPPAGNERRVEPWYMTIPTGQTLTITKELSDFLFSHTTPQIIPGPMRKREACMYTEIHNRVLTFQGMIGWWLSTQVDMRIHNMTMLMMEPVTRSQEVAENSVPSTTHAKPPQDAAAQEEKKIYVVVVMERLVSSLLRKADLNRTIDRPEDIIERLVEKTWAEVEGVDFKVDQNTFEDLDEVLLRYLCRRLGGVKSVLAMLRREDPALEKHIAAFIKDHLTTRPKRRSAICRFFSSVGGAFSRCCRRFSSV